MSSDVSKVKHMHKSGHCAVVWTTLQCYIVDFLWRRHLNLADYATDICSFNMASHEGVVGRVRNSSEQILLVIYCPLLLDRENNWEITITNSIEHSMLLASWQKKFTRCNWILNSENKSVELSFQDFWVTPILFHSRLVISSKIKVGKIYKKTQKQKPQMNSLQTRMTHWKIEKEGFWIIWKLSKYFQVGRLVYRQD